MYCVSKFFQICKFLSRLFRWARTYMDEIHAIQTRGATAVTTFRINAKTYIAIAQSQDSNGNYEVIILGQVCSMNDPSRLISFKTFRLELLS